MPVTSGTDGVKPISYNTAKSMTVVEECLTRELSTLGDVTTVSTEGVTTVMVRDGEQRPMLIDLAPPNVTITTKAAYGSREIIEDCL